MHQTQNALLQRGRGQVFEFFAQMVVGQRHVEIAIDKRFQEIAALPIQDQLPIIGSALIGPVGIKTVGAVHRQADQGVDDLFIETFAGSSVKWLFEARLEVGITEILDEYQSAEGIGEVDFGHRYPLGKQMAADGRIRLGLTGYDVGVNAVIGQNQCAAGSAQPIPAPVRTIAVQRPDIVGIADRGTKGFAKGHGRRGGEGRLSVAGFGADVVPLMIAADVSRHTMTGGDHAPIDFDDVDKCSFRYPIQHGGFQDLDSGKSQQTLSIVDLRFIKALKSADMLFVWGQDSGELGPMVQA